ncbi:aminopeptidase [Rhodococcus rhodnii LMG 5362]|uniref:Aminopeptidase N n=1 Tax=Rhodococcus rhodnii LMG 5362 TaxID=1273125 RepID=R7WSL0_9NOCA|nr:aminopeptidase [Rhodococcus rhodnii LMG 5362]
MKKTADEPIDSYLPQNGNRGYRVSRYDLDLTYKVSSNRLEATATVTAVTTQARNSFSLDLADRLDVTKVSIAGAGKVKYTHRGGKLTLTAGREFASGAAVVFVVRYGGSPAPLRSDWGQVGFEELTEGVIVASQPNGAASWFPCDDHPSAKAAYRIAITTDSPYTAVANGTLTERRTRASRTTWVYDQPEPMSTYLATLQIGYYDRIGVATKPVPIDAYVPARLRAGFEHDFARQREMMQVFETLFGPYPFPLYSVVVTDDDLEIPVEAQTLSVFGANHCDGSGRSERLVAHELAHQWFGNSLTARRWRDIWLHEGFACYAEWLWSENSGRADAAIHAQRAYEGLERTPRTIVVGDPGPASMFDDRVYKRGALTLHALRRELGDDAFFALLRRWTDEHRYGLVTTEQFVDLAVRAGDASLRGLFDRWLYAAPLPETRFA